MTLEANVSKVNSFQEDQEDLLHKLELKHNQRAIHFKPKKHLPRKTATFAMVKGQNTTWNCYLSVYPGVSAAMAGVYFIPAKTAQLDPVTNKYNTSPIEEWTSYQFMLEAS